MEGETCLRLSIVPDCFSISSSVSLNTGEEGRHCIIKAGTESEAILKVLAHTRTWRGGVDAVKKKLSCVQDRGGQRLTAAHFSLKTLVIIHTMYQDNMG